MGVSMIRSMTAFAREGVHDSAGEIVWELRSVNHRYLEAHVRLPEDFRVLEPVVREHLAARLGRGKIDCGMRFNASGAMATGLQINSLLADQLLEAANKMQVRMLGAPPPTVMDVLGWPGMVESGEQDFTPLHKLAIEVLDKAIDSLVETREREGARLRDLISQRIKAMGEQVARARKRMPEVIKGIKIRLRDRLAELSDELDEGRLEQEMAILAQRLDIDEEMDRLNAHIQEVESVLNRDEPVGRRLDFLMQELNREANTLGSKSADSETTAISVEMKVLIEQMREQVQNIE